jgi:hypothetical protein
VTPLPDQEVIREDVAQAVTNFPYLIALRHLYPVLLIADALRHPQLVLVIADSSLTRSLTYRFGMLALRTLLILSASLRVHLQTGINS